MSLLIAILACLPQDDKAAEELLKKVTDRVAAATTIQGQFQMRMDGLVDIIKGQIKIRGTDKILMSVSMGETQNGDLKCDGHKLLTKGDMFRQLEHRVDAAKLASHMRTMLSQSLFAGVLLLFESHGGALPTPGEVRWEGAEKVEGTDAAVITYKLNIGNARLGDLPVKAWIDSKGLAILKRQVTFQGSTVTETYSQLQFDVDIPEDEFLFQSAATLLKGRTLQLQRSVELFVRFTGVPPRKIEDLATRPDWLDKDIFWPEGGFWLGAAVPTDIPYSAEGTTARLGTIAIRGDRRAVVSPSERLSRYYSARVKLALLASAAEAFLEAYADLPRRRADFWQKPEWARVWPDGGFLPGGKVPDDPWGTPYRVITEEERLIIEVKEFPSRFIRLKDLTPEERKALEEGAAIRLSEKETAEINALIDGLGAEGLEERDLSEEKIRAWGAAAAGLIEQRLKTAEDAEVKGRLRNLLKATPLPQAAWMAELKSLSRAVGVGRGEDGGSVSSNERNASASLKTLTTAEADFRSNDRDENRVNDFWVKDVISLYGMDPTGKDKMENIIKLIEPSTAAADTSPNRQLTEMLKEAFATEEPTPKAGYFYSVLEKHQDRTGAEVAYDDGAGRNRNQFGFVAYPAEYGASGTRTFIVNEDNTIWMKDTGGDPVTVFPADPAADGWTPLD